MHKDAFLITSYTGGNNSELKRRHLGLFIDTIRAHFPGAFVLIADHFPLTEELQKKVDFAVYDSNNFNEPHGHGERSSIVLGLSILHTLGFNHCYKFNYDYSITPRSHAEMLKWKEMDKKIVACEWRRSMRDQQTFPQSIASALGYWHIPTALTLFIDPSLNGYIEYWVRKRVTEMGITDDVFVYPSIEDAMGGENETVELFLMAGQDKVHWISEKSYEQV